MENNNWKDARVFIGGVDVGKVESVDIDDSKLSSEEKEILNKGGIVVTSETLQGIEPFTASVEIPTYKGFQDHMLATIYHGFGLSKKYIKKLPRKKKKAFKKYMQLARDSSQARKAAIKYDAMREFYSGKFWEALVRDFNTTPQ